MIFLRNHMNFNYHKNAAICLLKIKSEMQVIFGYSTFRENVFFQNDIMI